MYCYQTMFSCCTCFSVQNNQNNIFGVHTLKQWFTVLLYRICFMADAYADFFGNTAKFLSRRKCIKIYS